MQEYLNRHFRMMIIKIKHEKKIVYKNKISEKKEEFIVPVSQNVSMP